MSSDRPSGGRSPEAEPGAPQGAGGSEPGEAARVRIRGALLIDAVDRHLPGAREHAEWTASYAFVTAVETGHDRAHSELIREAAKLHEVGKVYVPSALLARPYAELDADERAEVDSHHEAGATLARGSGIPDRVCEWILHARERFDGDGPTGMGAAEIPIESRIIRAACCCDLLLAERDSAAEVEAGDERRREAVEQLRAAAGHELDPELTEAIVGMLELT